MEVKQKNTGLVVTLVIFIVISLGLGGFICYDKLIKTEEEPQCPELNCPEVKENSNAASSNENSNAVSSNENSNTTQVSEQKDNYQVVALTPIEGLAVLYNGEVYVNISGPNADQIYGNGTYNKIVKLQKTYKKYSFGELTTLPVSGESTWLKINVTDVKAIYNNTYGQSIDVTNPKYGIVMLNADNTVSYIKISSLINGSVNPTKLNITNVTSVKTVENDGYTTYLVKADGKKTDVNTLIK